MTVRDLFDFIGDTKSSAHKDSTLMMWVNELEALIQTEVFLLNIEDVMAHTADTETLLADNAHTKIYWAYIYAMIDLANREFSAYQDSVQVFNGFMSEYKCWYANRYHPADGLAEVSGYYLSAYALAVKHGYTGTEEEWVSYISANADKAQAAQAAAEAAQAGAVAAQAGAEGARDTATIKATEAAGSAQSAADSAASANSAAGSIAADAAAAQAAKVAAEAAQALSEKAQGDAEGAAIRAEVDAKTAALKASEAYTSAGEAETAQTAAETARTSAEAAQTLSQAAQTAAETAKTQAQTAQAGAEGASDTAATKATEATGSAQAAAQSASSADISAGTADTKARDAEAWAIGKRGGVDVSPTDPAYQNNALWYKSQAQSIVGGDYPTKAEAQGYAATAKTQANAYTDTQIAAIPPVDISGKVDKVTGKGLSENDYTTIEKEKLAGIASGAQVNVRADWNAETGDAQILNKPSHLPASDVAAWAKAAEKPTYTAEEVGAAPESHTHPAATPSAHKTTHAIGGTDAITPLDIGAATPYHGTATLAVANWVGSAAPYTYTIAVVDMTNDDNTGVGVAYSADEAANAVLDKAWQAAKPRIESVAGQLKIIARGTKPTVAIPIFYRGSR